MATRSMVENHDLYRIITPFEGYDDKYSSVLEFKEYLTAEYLSSEKCDDGWVFWAPERDDERYKLGSIISDSAYSRGIREKIRRVLTRLMSFYSLNVDMVQFWALIKVGDRSILTTSDQPFAVNVDLGKGASWLRKKCMEHHYIVDDGAEKEQLGPPGRVFRNGRPESSPDIRLYSVNEFPLRDHVASCGEISYLALPVFDLHHNQCVGVLEFVSCIDGANILWDGSDICHELEVFFHIYLMNICFVLYSTTSKMLELHNRGNLFLLFLYFLGRKERKRNIIGEFKFIILFLSIIHIVLLCIYKQTGSKDEDNSLG